MLTKRLHPKNRRKGPVLHTWADVFSTDWWNVRTLSLTGGIAWKYPHASGTWTGSQKNWTGIPEIVCQVHFFPRECRKEAYALAQRPRAIWRSTSLSTPPSCLRPYVWSSEAETGSHLSKGKSGSVFLLHLADGGTAARRYCIFS